MCIFELVAGRTDHVTEAAAAWRGVELLGEQVKTSVSDVGCAPRKTELIMHGHIRLLTLTLVF